MSSDKRLEIGILRDSKIDTEDRFTKLAGIIESELPSESAKYTDWQLTSLRWAELLNMWYSGVHSSATAKPLFTHLQTKIDKQFASWMDARYTFLHSQPAVKPVMVHHVARYLSRAYEDNSGQKLALIVIDGAAIHQWLAIRNVLSDQSPNLVFKEESIFAWLPTTTAVSRQAIFSGKPPSNFPNSINDTAKEPSLWSQYWVGQGLNTGNIAYMKGLGELADLNKVEELISNTQLKVAGFVVDKVDRIMHGMELGSIGMHNQVELWAQNGYLAGLIDLCLAKGYKIVITADHGNIEATGTGRILEGVVADQRGERVRVYSNEVLRLSAQQKYAVGMTGSTVGLPQGYFPMYASERTAFIQNTTIAVCHGGPNIEEVMVPFVIVERKK